MLSLELLAIKRALWVGPGGRKEHYNHVFKQVLQKAENRGTRLGEGNRDGCWAGVPRAQRLEY